MVTDLFRGTRQGLLQVLPLGLCLVQRRAKVLDFLLERAQSAESVHEWYPTPALPTPTRPFLHSIR